jgi:formate hydrogenlyase subunit 4
MNTDQLLDLLKSDVIQGLLVPLGAALVAGIASGIQEKLSAGIQSRSYR